MKAGLKSKKNLTLKGTDSRKTLAPAPIPQPAGTLMPMDQNP